MKPITFRAPAPKPIAPSTKSTAPYARPPAATPKPLAPAARPGALTLNSSGEGDRRRTQRVLLRVRANVHVAVQGKESTYEATTLSVNDHGAIIVLKHSLPIETHLILQHVGTNETVACRVTRTARQMPEGFHVPLEFDRPAPNFWRIAFPPTDWRPPEE